MPSFEAAVVAWIEWPKVPEGWTRHMTKNGNEYPSPGDGDENQDRNQQG